MELIEKKLYRQIATSTCNNFFIAYSGGMDSHSLLHAATKIACSIPQKTFQAVHINHGLHPKAASWAQHCQQQCQLLSIDLLIRTIKVNQLPGLSLEEVARDARYAAFKQLLPANACLLLAHHQDDQAETVLLQLFRGCGIKGLAAMPLQAPLGEGCMLRPFLACTRQQLYQYASAQQLIWLDDPSNLDIAFDRNYLRLSVLPDLYARWPTLGKSVSRTASHCAEAQQLLQQQAHNDISQHGLQALPDATKKLLARFQITPGLITKRLQKLPIERQRNVVRQWIVEQGLRLPNTHQLHRVLTEVISARQDRNPAVEWSTSIIRRYRDYLLITTPLLPHNPDQTLPWDPQKRLILPAGLGYLELCQNAKDGLKIGDDLITVRFRQGGEKCLPVGSQHHRLLKKMFQDYAIPAWLRDRVPLIYFGEQLAAVADFWICEPFAIKTGILDGCIQWLQD